MSSSSSNLVGPPMSSSSSKLLGPPELQNSPPKGLTENLSATYLSSGNPCLDFFFKVVPDTPPEYLTSWLDSAWKHHPLTTLKLICHLRGVRKTGKSDKEGFYTAALWLHKYHPKTLACNLKYMVDFGYFKDLPEILFRLLQGPNYRKVDDRIELKLNQNNNRLDRFRNRRARRGRRDSSPDYGRGEKTSQQKRIAALKKKKSKADFKAERLATLEKRLEAESLKVKKEMEEARNKRNEKKVELAKKAVGRYTRDPEYRFLHDCVSDVFAERLVSDLEALKSGETSKVGLASKWCPSLDSSFDRATLICESIAKRVFLRESYPEYEGVEEAHYAYRVRDRLRKEVLVPLRQLLEMPETYMSQNKWDSLPYNRVPSVAMTKYKEYFLLHDEERFKEFLGKVKRGEAKIAAGALLPHEIIDKAVGEYDSDDSDDDDKSDDVTGEVAELQWKRMVQDLLDKGRLRNCLPVCDVSGSMEGTPMEVCIALGLLVSELSEEPWKGNVMTFSKNPQLHKVKGADLKTKTGFIRRMDWGNNTDFQKVFDKILDVAVNGKLRKEQMIKKIFVFSDMEFDLAAGRRKNNNTWETDYEVIQRKFGEKGYEVPQIIFWNLRHSKATPVTADQKGVALVSGFSKNMVKLFLNEDEDLMLRGPVHVMNMAISGPEFSKLVVLD